MCFIQWQSRGYPLQPARHTSGQIIHANGTLLTKHVVEDSTSSSSEEKSKSANHSSSPSSEEDIISHEESEEESVPQVAAPRDSQDRPSKEPEPRPAPQPIKGSGLMIRGRGRGRGGAWTFQCEEGKLTSRLCCRPPPTPPNRPPINSPYLTMSPAQSSIHSRSPSRHHSRSPSHHHSCSHFRHQSRSRSRYHSRFPSLSTPHSYGHHLSSPCYPQSISHTLPHSLGHSQHLGQLSTPSSSMVSSSIVQMLSQGEPSSHSTPSFTPPNFPLLPIIPTLFPVPFLLHGNPYSQILLTK
ncbi:mediator of RNA polymerase II transcription subunit 1-like isoform X3 [Hyla sarda]|uniref:mediator of RNA polymerase II transcription subunit 1-like isoform X3 n=1 Tax=Hyla sarda TaxID=327740 RepID=UPI0024C42B59|nr:mediator of RNA polymerase II transcription subunit 1-like isoform X3 [Hyla sarda]